MSYIGIKERKSDSLIDWSKVGSDISDVIIKDAERRKSEKKAIEDQSNELITKARTEAPIGNADYINRIVSNYSDQVQQRQLQLHKMLKNGMVSQKDYTLFTNNLKTNTSELFNLFKEYQAEYDNKMDRYQKGISSIAEVKAMALVEGFGNLSEVVPVITEDGSAKLVRVGKDGKPLQGTDNAVSVSQAKSRIKEKFDKYNLNDDIKESIDQLGTVVIEKVKSEGKGGSALGFLEKITDPTVRLDEKGQEDKKSYIKAEKAIINEKLSSPYRIASVLFDFAKMTSNEKEYNITTDPNLAANDDSYILYVEKDGKPLQPDFSTENGKKQIAQAEELVRAKIRSGLSQKTELQAIQQPTPPQPKEPYRPSVSEMEYRDKQREKKSLADAWMGLRTAKTPQDLESYRQAILGSPFVRNVEKGQKGLSDIIFSSEDGRSQPTSIILKFDDDSISKVPLNSDPTKWAISGTQVHGITDEGQLKKNYGSRKFTNAIESYGNTMGPGTITQSKVPVIPQDVLKQESGKATAAINVILKGSGFVAKDTGGMWSNTVDIYKADKDGKAVGNPLGSFSTKGGTSADQVNQMLSRIYSGL